MQYSKGYNRSPYNRSAGRILKCSATLTGGATTSASGSNTMMASAVLSSDAIVGNKVSRGSYNRTGYNRTTLYNRTYKIVQLPEAILDVAVSAKLDGSGEVRLKEATVETLFGASLDAGATLMAVPAVEYSAKSILSAGTSDLLDKPGLIFTPKFNVDGSGELKSDGAVLTLRSASFESEGFMAVKAGNVDIKPDATLDGSGELKGKSWMEYGPSAPFNGSADLPDVDSVADYRPQAVCNAGSDLVADARMDYAAETSINGGALLLAAFETLQQETILFTGVLNPGDVLVISTCNYTATLNGENVLEQIFASENSGEDWIHLNKGSIELIVSADGNSEVEVKVDYTPAWK